MTEAKSPELTVQRDQLVERIRSWGPCAVAFSAGVDSTVVAKAAALALGDDAVAITGVSPSLAAGELESARALARQIGIRHLEIPTDEMEVADYTRNAPDRCYHCKTQLYRQIDRHRDQLGVQVVLNGANADDLSDYRPGTQAADEQHVRSPLAECGLRKSDVRALARLWELPIWNKPATPCLSSRIAYGEEVTAERLQMIDAAERVLREFDLQPVRVRYHKGDLARIEVGAAELSRLAEPSLREALVTQFQAIGFQFVTLDLAGFRSGSLNVLVPEEQLQRHQLR